MKHGGSARVMWTYKGGMKWTSGENWKEPSTSTISTEAPFNGYSRKATLNVNITCWQ